MPVLVCLSLICQAVAFLGNGISGVSAAPSQFVITYATYDDYSDANQEDTIWILVVRSNGAANLHAEGRYFDVNWSSHLSAAVVSDAYAALSNESFASLSGWHNDSGYRDQGFCNHSEAVSLDASGTNHTVTFGGNSLMGISPAVSALLNNILGLVQEGASDMLDVTLDVTVAERTPPSAYLNVSAVFTNNAQKNYSQEGLSNVSWPTFIVSTNGTTVADMQASSMTPSYETYEPGTSTPFGPWGWNRTGLQPGEYVVMSYVVVWSWTSTNIPSDAPWAGEDDDTTPTEPDENSNTLYIVAGGAAAVAVVGLAFYFVRSRGKTPGEKSA